MEPAIPLLIIAGPTGTGKTRLSINLAQKRDAEIISADSRQIYRHMDIGTGKPTPEEQEMAPHHMIDIVDPDQSYSAGEYFRQTRTIIDEIIERGKVPILVGGTGLYIRAVIEGLSPSPPSDPQIKKGLLKRMKNYGIKSLYEELLQKDPQTAKRLHPNDRQRIIRGLEVFNITGKPLSDLHMTPPDPIRHKTRFFFINRPRPVLYELIDKRVDNMFKRGLIDEAGTLLEKGYTREDPGMQSLGYDYLCDFIAGTISLQETKALMKRDTRRYAKRQVTWFRKEKEATCLEIPKEGDVLDLENQILDIKNRKS